MATAPSMAARVGVSPAARPGAEPSVRVLRPLSVFAREQLEEHAADPLATLGGPELITLLGAMDDIIRGKGAQSVMTLEEAKAILAALAQEGVDFVVVGSMAMAAQGLPRATHDLDVFVAPDIENLEAMKRALRVLFDDPNVDQIDPEELAGDYPAVEYVPPHGNYSMDILTRLGEAFTWQDLAAECDRIPLGDLVVQVATPRMLYRMKKDTVRLQDRADAARIREAFNLEDD